MPFWCCAQLVPQRERLALYSLGLAGYACYLPRLRAHRLSHGRKIETRPPYNVDSLPPLHDVGPGSPVGVEFGYGAKFPAKYQKAFYCCDWTFGTMYAMHLVPDGSTYKAVKEEFLSRTPLPLTDAAVGPDGALYFVTGGRGTQSELFCVSYVGKEPPERAEYRDPRNAELRADACSAVCV